MAEAVTYAELDVDYCTRSYGDGIGAGGGACLADRGFGWPDNSRRAGVSLSQYVGNGAGLTGATDSKKFTLIGSVRKTANDSANQVIFTGVTAFSTDHRFLLRCNSSNQLQVLGLNAAGTVILDVTTPTDSFQIADGWIHFAISVDLSDSGKRHCLINGAEVGTWNTYTDDSIDFTVVEWAIGAYPLGTVHFDGVIGRLWFEDDFYVDLSDADNLALVWDASGETGMPVYLGPSGENITGSPPIVFQAGGTWDVAFGTGGDFGNLFGTVTEVPFATGQHKCFNTLKSCQDRDNFNATTVTHRFAMPALHLADDIDAIPCVRAVQMSPGQISLGEDLGIRASVSVAFEDFLWPDTGEGFDKYYAERTYDPYSQGTFWGKFRARQPFLRGKALRIIRGTADQAIADMETRHYFVESFDGPSPRGLFQITAKDGLKLADDDRAKAPAPNTGYLQAAITDSDTAATLVPAGVGDDEYAASGYLCIGGNEIVSFTRSGDSLTIARGALGTTAQAHNAQDRVQTVLRYSGDDAADIVNDLLLNYTDLASGNLPVADWQEETAAFLLNVYTATIAEPTGVATLLAELVQQAGLVLWWDAEAQQVRLRVLRAIPAEVELIDADVYLAGSLEVREQPNKRLSQIWTYYGQVDPTKPLSELDNYRSIEVTVDLEAQADYGSPAVKAINSRWIPALGRSIATRLNDILLGRFRDPPRQVQFALLRHGDYDVNLGDTRRVAGWSIQDETGASDEIPVQVTSLSERDSDKLVEAEEVLFRQYQTADLDDRVITIDTDYLDFNLRAVHDTLFPAITAQDVSNGVTLTCIIASGAIVGASSTGVRAFDVGSFPAGLPILLVVNGRIQGAGGRGGKGGYANAAVFPPVEVAPEDGEGGGTALYTRQAITLELNTSGEIWGGGGAGPGGSARGVSNQYEGGAGGGGQGKKPGKGGVAVAPGKDGTDATPEAPGVGGKGDAPWGNEGGDGGAKGQPGDSSSFSSASPGSAGNAIDGVSYVTVSVNDGDRAGPEVN